MHGLLDSELRVRYGECACGPREFPDLLNNTSPAFYLPTPILHHLDRPKHIRSDLWSGTNIAMRLLHIKRLQFEEFYDDQIPQYAILSHRWGSVDQEVSYEDFKAQRKTDTAGYAKILNFCRVASDYNVDFCWVDACCIDKTSSAELTEAINSMFLWYQRAAICCVYLQDAYTMLGFSQSDWFTRGWTLQELIAPTTVEFYDKEWWPLGTRSKLSRQISEISGIDEALLAREKDVRVYSVAQKMSWAASRRTSRLEDEAYCLLGLFGVNMPLLHGEGAGAFQRLQEQIISIGDDYSLLAWDFRFPENNRLSARSSALAPSPRAFQKCGKIEIDILTTQRTLFEVTNQGMTLLIHRSYDRETLDDLLAYDPSNPKIFDDTTGELLVLTIPLNCYQRKHRPERAGGKDAASFFLQLFLTVRNGFESEWFFWTSLPR